MRFAIILIAALIGPSIASGEVEDRSTEHRSFAGVNDLMIDNISGDIEVTAYNGNSVEMDIEKTLTAATQDRLSIAKKEVSLKERRENGLLEIMVDGPFRCHCGDNSNYFGGEKLYSFHYTFKVRVPRAIRLQLRDVNKSHISVEGTAGEFDISNVNGGIEMRGIEGSGTVHTVNGEVKAVFARSPAGATSFKTVNGTLDVTFPPGLNADVRVKTFHGEIFTDFPVTASPVSMQPERRDGKMVWGRNRMTAVRIGSGGPELSFETLNGQIFIRNREK
jgi:DUF4097 and DUF4098 domain-containing protein YvlB